MNNEDAKFEAQHKYRTGQRFGSRVVLEDPFYREGPAGQRGTKRQLYAVVGCDCGRRLIVRCSSLPRHEICKACASRIQNTTHGDSKTPLYRCWYAMRHRCESPDDAAFSDYGGRGITVCQEWTEFEVFKNWALANGYRSDLQIDRRDNNRGYSPDNCRFVTSKVNQRNRRNNHLVTAFGETKPVSAWMEDPRCKVARELTLRRRFQRGENPELSITTPSRLARGMASGD